tara:strand:- start:264 stop:428 length:165 start_codon:yes stop_codon:yes gene_type:complete
MVKYGVIFLNTFLILMGIGFLMGHGMPNNIIMWVSLVLWFVVPLVNVGYIVKKI